MAPTPTPTPTPTRVHIARDGSLRQLLPAFVLCHYLLYTVPVVGALWLAYAYELVPRRGLLGCVGAYLASIVLYRPHLGRGWWWGRPLYESSIWDGVAGFLDTTFVREAPLAPDRQYIFAICPHGILSVVRALFLGSTFPKLFPSVYGRWVGATPQFLAPFGCRKGAAQGVGDCFPLSALAGHELTDTKEVRRPGEGTRLTVRNLRGAAVDIVAGKLALVV